MKFQKTLLAVASAAMAFGPFASTMPVCANGLPDEDPTTKSTTLNYNVTEVYEWEIHTDIDFGRDKGVNKTDVNGAVTDGSDQKVKVTKNVIGEGSKLRITAHGSGADNAFSIKNDGTEVLNYAVKSGTNAVGVNGTVLEVAAGTNTGETEMDFKLSTTTKEAEVAGNYTGTITYNSEILRPQA